MTAELNMTPAAPRRSVPVTLMLAIAVALGALGAGVVYLNRPTASPGSQGGVTPEARAYLSHLELSDVTMNASESFTNQRLVEVEGKITNHGDRTLASVSVFCIFYNLQGREIHRERSTVIQARTNPLAPNQTRTFRLPFDALPDGWNQAVPRMVIAGIVFAS